jgi:oleate hydratase
MTPKRKAYFVGGGIGALAGAAFLIRDGGMAGQQITVLEAGPVMGGSLDGAGDAESGYFLRGARMLATDDCACTWALFKSIPSLTPAGRSVFDETLAFNEAHRPDAQARLVDARCAKLPVSPTGFSVQDRAELLRLVNAPEASLGASCITDHLSPAFFDTPFWFMWATTFAIQPWHGAVEFRRYLHRFLGEFLRTGSLASIRRTALNPCDAMVWPLQQWLQGQGVRMVNGCTVTGLDHRVEAGNFEVIALHATVQGQAETMQLEANDLVFVQNGSMSDAASLGSLSAAPAQLSKAQGGSWTLWEKLALGRPEFGRPDSFNRCVAQSSGVSFSVTLKDTAFFDRMQDFSGSVAGAGGRVTFKDSNWLMSIVLAHQPHFAHQPVGVQVFWGDGLFPDRIGNFVAKSMADCSGAELLQELCGHLRFDPATVAQANCIPCRMPYITSLFMPRSPGDRPLPVPPGTRNFAFISPFVELPLEPAFTVEFSVRAAQMAVHQLLGIAQALPPATPQELSLHGRLEALVEALR